MAGAGHCWAAGGVSEMLSKGQSSSWLNIFLSSLAKQTNKNRSEKLLLLYKKKKKGTEERE